MARKIQVLPEHVVQNIAAGEVVERPASVLKELVENSIDAGSRTIGVELKSGGLKLIRVVDDGEGMEKEDVPLALKRYATSKIATAEDLYKIRSLGFRGEALPSIAAVSQMVIKTRAATSLHGTEVLCEGGEIRSIAEIGSPVGTEVEVRNLFYNLPVKRKFLKSVRAELHQCLNYFLRLALSYPSISFRLIHDDRTLHDLVQAGDPSVRIESLLGRETYNHLKRFEFEDSEIKFSGFASVPSFFKANGDGIYIFVNQRFVRDRLIYKAVLEAYRHLLPTGRFPVALIWLDVPPEAVDVNVHPTKAEVKFKDPERIFLGVNRALRTLLESARPPSEFGPPEKMPIEGGGPSAFPLGRNEEAVTPVVRESSEAEWLIGPRRGLRPLGQIDGTFILCEGAEGLVIIDQHAAHERLLYEEYKHRHEARSVPVINFLLPPLIELSAEESFLLSSLLEEFLALGFEIDPVGEKAFAIRSAPQALGQEPPQEIVKEMLEEVASLRREEKGTEPIHALLIRLACHTAIRGHALLSPQEMEELVGRLALLPLTMTCPHGRPIFFQMSREELNRVFRRRQ